MEHTNPIARERGDSSEATGTLPSWQWMGPLPFTPVLLTLLLVGVAMAAVTFARSLVGPGDPAAVVLHGPLLLAAAGVPAYVAVRVLTWGLWRR